MKNKFYWIFAALLLMVSGLASANEVDPALANDKCLACHDGEKTLDTPSANAELEALQPVEPEGYSDSVHAELNCIDCHTEIGDARADHQKSDDGKVQDCVSCHRQLLAEAEADGDAPGRLKTVIENAEAHQRSFHAGEREDQPGTIRADCEDCHSSHSFAVPAEKDGDEYDTWRLSIPALCGDCHEEEKEKFLGSVHGINLQEYENAEAAVCSDCHTTHEIGQADLDSFKLLLPDECGGCHAINLRTYRDTYHGQVNALGYTNTAKCYDCHGGHDITEVADPESKVHPDNRLETCRTCHDGEKAALATAGFISYDPHAHAGDFERYPEVWFASKFMLALLVGVFLFFWTHSILWYYREWRSRGEMAPTTRVNTSDLDDWLGHQVADGSLDDKRHFLRFGVGWRWAHLAFALVTMTLVLTGTSLLYAGSDWAPVVINALGGAETAGLIHRVAALLFIGIFFTHFVIVMIKLLRSPDFRWFGPDSLVPRWQDFIDCWKMFRWFFGKGEKPLFDRWAYYEKFDYWAVFWGVNVIGASGIMLAFPDFTASFLPGWVFNVAAIVHGEEAFLAAVFLFTVHFFNNHFRPDKIPPPDIVMFSGTQSLDEFRRDHTKQYRRLKESGELEKYLVEAPSATMTTGFKLLGLTLIAIGLILLVLVINGYLFY